MKTSRILQLHLVLFVLAWLGSGCKSPREINQQKTDENQNTPIASSVLLKNTITPLTPITPAQFTSQSTPTTPVKSLTSTPSITPSITPSQPIATHPILEDASPYPPPGEDYEVVSDFFSETKLQAFQHASLTTVFSDTDFWIARYDEPFKLIHLVDEMLAEEIEFLDIKHPGDIKIHETGIWILELGIQPQDSKYLLHFDLNGKSIDQYEIPAWMYTINGVIDDSGPQRIFWDQNQEVLIEWGSNGLYRFLDSQGVKQVKRLDGFHFDNHLYRVIGQKQREVTQTRWLAIDQNWISVTTTMDHVNIELLGVFQGGVYVRVFEINRNGDSRTSIRHYDPEGKLLGESRIPTSEFPDHELVIGSNEKVYLLISPSHGHVQLIAMKFH